MTCSHTAYGTGSSPRRGRRPIRRRGAVDRLRQRRRPSFTTRLIARLCTWRCRGGALGPEQDRHVVAAGDEALGQLAGAVGGPADRGPGHEEDAHAPGGSQRSPATRAGFGGRIRAGTPTAVAPGGTSSRTTALAPTTAPSPTETSPSTFAPGVDEHVVADRRPVVGPGEADRDLLVDPAVPPDPAGGDDRGEPVLDEQPGPDVGAGQVERALARVHDGEHGRERRRCHPGPAQAVGVQRPELGVGRQQREAGPRRRHRRRHDPAPAGDVRVDVRPGRPSGSSRSGAYQAMRSASRTCLGFHARIIPYARRAGRSGTLRWAPGTGCRAPASLTHRA